ncbi:MAG: SufS family cysteine desulfurase [Gammaproteobacteria bacterium]
MNAFDVNRIRADFPILSTHVHQRPLVYLDNAATTQKPTAVIDAMDHYYRHDNANVHRGLHALSERATQKMESARREIATFINARRPEQVIFTKGTTDALNLLAHSLSQVLLQADDEIVITHMEHHSNIVPWQMACERTGAILRVVRINDQGELDRDHLNELLSAKTRIVSFTAISNSLGTINPVAEIIQQVRQHPDVDVERIAISVDAAQALAHQAIDVRALDCDFLAFSAHKAFGPTGIGALYGKADWLERLPPYQGGGEMIRTVHFDKSTYADIPHKFEAGTPAIAEAIGFGAAIAYLKRFAFRDIIEHEHRLLQRATDRLLDQPGTRLIGEAAQKAGVISLICDEVHPHDLGTLLDFEGIAVRAGHHCTMPVMERYGVPATVRISLSLYNTIEEIDIFCDALSRVRKPFRE